MKRIFLIFLIFGAFAQAKQTHALTAKNYDYSQGIYVVLGYTKGPDFADFFDYMNNTYPPLYNNFSDKLERFGGNISFGLGYISRFHRNFALDVGFCIYHLESRGEIIDLRPGVFNDDLFHDLDYQVGIFSATIPVLLQFSSKQAVVPYVGIGMSFFSIRLDHYREEGNLFEALRETSNAVGGHFEGGLNFRITPKIWLDLKGRWHNGTDRFETLEFEEAGRRFIIKQDITQYTLGVIYYFR